MFRIFNLNRSNRIAKKSRGFKRAQTNASYANHAGWMWAIAGAASGLMAALIYCAPAVWLGSLVTRWSDGYVRLINPSGSMWNGSAVLLLASGTSDANALSLPTRLEWQLRPHWSGMKGLLSSSCCTTQPIHLDASFLGLRIGANHIRLPIDLLQGLGTPWNTLGLQGGLDLHTEGVALVRHSKGWQLDGKVVARLNHISTRLTTLPDVGSYEIELLGGSQPQLNLQTLRGDLKLQGKGQWQGRKFVFRGEAQASPANAATLNNLLTLLGDRQGNVTKIKLG